MVVWGWGREIVLDKHISGITLCAAEEGLGHTDPDLATGGFTAFTRQVRASFIYYDTTDDLPMVWNPFFKDAIDVAFLGLDTGLSRTGALRT